VAFAAAAVPAKAIAARSPAALSRIRLLECMLSSPRSAIKPQSISQRGVLALAFRHNCMLWNLSFQAAPTEEDGWSVVGDVAALQGGDVSLYFQGPAVRVLAKGFTEHLHGPGRPFSRIARTGLTRAGHIPAQEKLRQLQALGARLYACAGSMQHFKVARTDLAFSDLTVAEYLTFMEIMASADINVFIQ